VDTILTFSASRLFAPLLIAALVSAALLGMLAWRTPYLARAGLRHIGRRKARTALIVFGLMLSTSFVASSIAVDDTIALAVKTVAVFNLGRIDEDVTAGGGAMAQYPASYGGIVSHALAGDPHVAGVAPALVVPNLLVADVTARQVRGGVSAFAIQPERAGPLGDLRDPAGARRPVQALGAGEVYLNRAVGQLLNAQPGDTVDLYSTLWKGERYPFRVKALVTGGPLGDNPAIVLPLPVLQRLAVAEGFINHIYVANAGDGLTGVGYSDEIASRMVGALPGLLGVSTVKQDGVTFAVRTQDVSGRILTLYTLFALAIGLMLIFLLFVLLAAERRAELGMARALGLRRGHVVRMLLFEGAAYDAVAAAAGILAGLGLGIAIVHLVSPTIARIGFPLRIAIEPRSVAVAFCLGLVFTLATIWLAAWTVTRMSVAAALRDLPEPPPPRPSLLAHARRLARALLHLKRRPDEVVRSLSALVWALVVRGPLMLALGLWLARQGVAGFDMPLFSLGLSLALAGGALALRWLALAAVAFVVKRRQPGPAALLALARADTLADRLTALLAGGAIALYWSLPYDALARYGLPRFGGGVQVFFLAGVLMVFGLVLALAPNLDLLLLPLRWLAARVGARRHVTRIALVYPAQQRFRTGVGLALFTLVCFTMVVMACIAASTTASYDDLPAQTADYDVAGQPLFTPLGGADRVVSALRSASASDSLSAVSSAAPLPLGIIQPGAPNARWSLYPASAVQGSFLDGVGLPLVARADGYAGDADIWRALRGHPGYAVIDAGALSRADLATLGLRPSPPPPATQFAGPPIASGLPGLDDTESLDGGAAAQIRRNPTLEAAAALAADPGQLRRIELRLRGVASGPGAIRPTPIWVSDLRGGPATKLTIIGVVDNARGQRYGLFASPASFAPAEIGQPPFGGEYYYFKVRPGADPHAVAAAVGSRLLDYGFETTVMQDALLDVNGPRVFISRVLVGLVGLTLLVGLAALAITGSRSVVERRQQIGMLRALGFRRRHVQAIFLIESLLVGAIGTAAGLALGLILCRNIFAVDFFAQFQSGLTLVVPWRDLAVICAAALAAAALASLLPAWQAGRVAPADALRYE